MKHLRTFRISTAIFIVVLIMVAGVLSAHILGEAKKRYFVQFPEYSKQDREQSYRTASERYVYANEPFSEAERYDRLFALRMLRGSYERARTKEETIHDPRLRSSSLNDLRIESLDKLIEWTKRTPISQFAFSYVYASMAAENQAKEVESRVRFEAIDESMAHRSDWLEIGFLFLWVLLCGIIPMHFCFVGRLKDIGCDIATELRSGRLLIYDLIWPIGLICYHTTPLEQAKNTARMLSYALGLFLAVMGCSAKTLAQQKHEEDATGSTITMKATWELNSSVFAKYLGLDGAIFHNGMDSQTSLTKSFENGFRVGLWYAEPIQKRSLQQNFGREWDVIVGWTGKIKYFNVDLKTTYIDVTPQAQLPRGDVLELSGKLSGSVIESTKQTVEPYIWVRRAVPVRGGAPKAGTFYHLGTNYNLRITERLEINSDIATIHDSGAFGFDSAWLARWATDVGWKLTDHMRLILPSVTSSVPMTHVRDGRKFELVFGGGFSWTW